MEDAAILLGKYAAVLAVGVTGVWATTEAIGRSVKKVPNIFIALPLGIAFAVVAEGMKLLPHPEGVTQGWAYAFAVIMGLLSVGGSKMVNDKINPLNKNR